MKNFFQVALFTSAIVAGFGLGSAKAVADYQNTQLQPTNQARNSQVFVTPQISPYSGIAQVPTMAQAIPSQSEDGLYKLAETVVVVTFVLIFIDRMR